jgi:hypothetical protein
MPFLKFSALVFVMMGLFANAFAFERKQCLEKDFSMTITHKGALWGFLKNTLVVQKDKCIITIKHKKHHPKIPGSEWKVDVCREPVHIKSMKGGVEVYKREGVCDLNTKGKMSDYCFSTKEIVSALQDEGLIFAEGEKENIHSQHGQVYCVYDLLKDYLIRGMVLSRYTKVIAPVPTQAPIPADPNAGSSESPSSEDKGDF